MSDFDAINHILNNKAKYEYSDTTYNSYLVNKALSYYDDCIFFSNEMNKIHHIDKNMQFDFLRSVIRSKKRPYIKWSKIEKMENIDSIKIFFNCSTSKAKEYLKILSDKQIKDIIEHINFGGK